MIEKQLEPADKAVAAKGYVHPEVLVSTQWVADHPNDPSIRIVESNEDILLYDQGHIPGAIQIDWAGDLNDKLRCDYLDRKWFSELMSRDGIGNNTTVVQSATRSTGGRAMLSGDSSYSGIPMQRSWMAAVRSGSNKGAP